MDDFIYHPRWQCVWSADELAHLRHGLDRDQTAETIAASMGRTARAILEKCDALGLVRPRSGSWWPKERIACCKQLYDEGKSGAEIAREIGVTRSAVLGFQHRNPELFPPRTHLVNGHSAVKKVSRRKIPRSQVPLQPEWVTEPYILTDTAPFSYSDEVSLWPVSIVETASHHCRFPVWAKPYLMCGADKVDGHSYCHWHCRIAFTSHKRAPRPFIQRRWEAR